MKSIISFIIFTTIFMATYSNANDWELENVVFHHQTQFFGQFFFDGSLNQPVNYNLIAFDGKSFPEKHDWRTGTVWWKGTEPYFTVKLDKICSIRSFVVQADNNDAYRIYYHAPGTPSESWQVIYDVPADPQYGGMRTRNIFSLDQPVNADAFKIKAVNGDDMYSIGEITVWGSVAKTYSDRMRFDVNNHYYQRIDQNMTWHGAKTYCENLGGHLATATSKEENDFIFYKLINNSKYYWLGGTDEKVEGQWEWITGEQWSYSNWNGGEPNNYGNEDYLHFWNNNTWNDAIRNIAIGAICEWDTEPVTLSGCISMKEKSLKNSTAMVMQSGETYQSIPLDVNGCYKFNNVNEDKPLSVLIRKTMGQ